MAIWNFSKNSSDLVAGSFPYTAYTTRIGALLWMDTAETVLTSRALAVPDIFLALGGLCVL